jgi:hypothetical protein
MPPRKKAASYTVNAGVSQPAYSRSTRSSTKQASVAPASTSGTAVTAAPVSKPKSRKGKRVRADSDSDDVPSKKAKIDKDDNTTNDKKAKADKDDNTNSDKKAKADKGDKIASDKKADDEAKNMVSTRSVVVYRSSLSISRSPL